MLNVLSIRRGIAARLITRISFVLDRVRFGFKPIYGPRPPRSCPASTNQRIGFFFVLLFLIRPIARVVQCGFLGERDPAERHPKRAPTSA